MTIHEPMTFATDMGLTVLAVVLGVKLRRFGGPPGPRAQKLWSWAFLLSGMATFLGGFWHGFFPELSPRQSWAIWTGAMLFLGLSSLALERGSLVSGIRDPLRRLLTGVVAAKCLLFLGWCWGHEEFFPALLQYGSGLVLVGAVETAGGIRGERPSVPWIFASLGLSAMAIGVQISELGLHPSFNHNDLYHALQAMALVLLYRGGTELKDWS